MSTQEILNRSVLAVKKTCWRKRKQWIAPKPIFRIIDAWSPDCPLTGAGDEMAFIEAEAQKYLDHNFTLLNVNFSGDEIDWHMDPETKKRCPIAFGLDIDYRNRDIAGNIKNIWELNRHHHLTMLAVAYAVTHREIYAIEIEYQLKKMK